MAGRDVPSRSCYAVGVTSQSPGLRSYPGSSERQWWYAEGVISPLTVHGDLTLSGYPTLLGVFPGLGGTQPWASRCNAVGVGMRLRRVFTETREHYTSAGAIWFPVSDSRLTP